MDLAAVTDGMINTMTYEAGGVELIVPVGHRSKIRIVCSMLAHWTHEKRGLIDVTSITANDFSTWRLSAQQGIPAGIPRSSGFRIPGSLIPSGIIKYRNKYKPATHPGTRLAR
jgi:hypothetical protein